MPIVGVQRAAALESSHEDRGRLAYLKPDGNLDEKPLGITDATATEVTDGGERPIKPEFKVAMTDGSFRQYNDIHEWIALWMSPNGIIARMRDKPGSLLRYRELNGPIMASLAAAGFREHVMQVQQALSKSIGDPEELNP